MDLIEKLNWRFAAKAMNGEIIPQEKIDKILEAIRLTATSSGLQPYELIVITNQKIKEQIKPFAWDQPQITDCSHLLVFAAWDNYTEDRINKMFDLTNEIRGFKNEGWENYRQMLLDKYPKRSEQENFEHASKQVYIALGTALIAAAYEKVDATPMEGFLPEEIDKILNLKDKALKSVLLLPLGYRNKEKDWLVDLPKIRRLKEDFITEIN